MKPERWGEARGPRVKRHSPGRVGVAEGPDCHVLQDAVCAAVM